MTEVHSDERWKGWGGAPGHKRYSGVGQRGLIWKATNPPYVSIRKL